MPEIILYAYPEAPNNQKVISALALLRIPYKLCLIPRMLPRPDFTSVDITYRRVPLLSIDSDIYVDTSLIISQLCARADQPNHRTHESLGREPFGTAVALMPPAVLAAQGPAFLADRAALVGPQGSFSPAAFAKARPHSLATFTAWLAIVERDLLADGRRKFVLGGEVPTMADVHLHYVVQWAVNGHRGARPEVSRDRFPAVFAWLEGVNAYLKLAARPDLVSWPAAKELLLKTPGSDVAGQVKHDVENVLGLKVGAEVNVTPVDTGRSHPQRGTLVALNNEQVCLRNGSGLVMHFPRMGYAVTTARAKI